jgi:hypothetical protein
MIGTRLRRRRDKTTFRVVGRDGGQWVLAPDVFGSPLAASELEISELYAVIGEDAKTPSVEPATRVVGRSASEQAGYEALAERSYEAFAAAREKPTAPPALTPEESLRSGELTAAEIVSSPKLRWAYQRRALDVPPRVAAAVDELLRNEAA